jgi:ketosteroid isomerase-like protein
MNKTVRRIATLTGLMVSGLLADTMALAADSQRVALEATTRRWTTAVNTQDVDTLRRTMTEDVRLLDGQATVTGRDAAIRALREIVARGQVIVTNSELEIAGDVACRVVRLAQTQENGDVHARGQALEIWKRVKGEWKLHTQMAPQLISPAISLTRPSTSEPVLDQPQLERRRRQ